MRDRANPWWGATGACSRSANRKRESPTGVEKGVGTLRDVDGDDDMVGQGRVLEERLKTLRPPVLQ
jgi:hypothetical protein